MFLTILIFPTALLQANMLITINLEKLDMVFNTLALIVNFAICIIGLNFIKSLSVVNYSIFASFLVFHIAQDAVLIKRGITTFKSAATFYFITIIFVVSYVTLSKIVNAYGLFGFTWMGILFFVFFKPQKTVYQRYKLKKSYTD
jgi:hypothetical protein